MLLLCFLVFVNLFRHCLAIIDVFQFFEICFLITEIAVGSKLNVQFTGFNPETKFLDVKVLSQVPPQ